MIVLRKILIISAAILMLQWNYFAQSAFAEDMTDFDYDFIDNAFSKPNPTTNKQFEEVMKRYEQEPNGIMYRMKRWFNRNNPEYDKELKKQYEAPNKQPARIKDTPLAKPTITIGADFYDENFKTLAAGHYQIEYKEENGKYNLVLLQGKTRVAEIKAIPYEDNWQTPAVLYCRTEIVNEKLVRIIYSNLDITLLGYIRLK